MTATKKILASCGSSWDDYGGRHDIGAHDFWFGTGWRDDIGFRVARTLP